jgi:outer membrane protein assembly factor BamD
MKIHRLPVSLCLLCLLLACGPAPPVSTPDAEDQYLLATEKFEDRKYIQAQLEYQKLIWNYPGSDLVDDAQYHLAESHRLLEDYPTAVVEYSRMLRSYSRSPFAPAAQYKLALCYYLQSLPSHLDQDFTHTAIRELKTFLDEHPQHEYAPEAQKLLLEARTKLAKKEYDNARLYYKMDAYDSAIIYIEELLAEYPDTKWADDAHYLIGECYREQGNWEDALEAYRQVLELDSSGKVARQAQKRIRQIEEKLPDREASSG